HTPGETNPAEDDLANKIQPLLQGADDKSDQAGEQGPHQNRLPARTGKAQALPERHGSAFQGAKNLVVKGHVKESGQEHRQKIHDDTINNSTWPELQTLRGPVLAGGGCLHKYGLPNGFPMLELRITIARLLQRDWCDEKEQNKKRQHYC